MDCITYINLNPNNIPVTITGTTCSGIYTATTLNYGQAICMDNTQQIYTCGNADIGASCFNPTPPVTPTMTPTPTCPIFTQQYMEVQLQSCSSFKLILWNNSNFTSAANAVCDVVVSGCAYGDQGTVYCGTETITTTQHQHNFNLSGVLLPGECVTGFTVSTVTPQCSCYTVTYVPQPSPTPTVTSTHTLTPTITTTHTPSPTNTTTPTITPTITTTPGLSPTPTITETNTPTPSITETITPSITPTSSIPVTPTPTPTETPPCEATITVDNNTTGGADITGVSVNTVPVTYVSGDNFTISNGEFGTFSTTITGSPTIYIDYTTTENNRNINVVDCANPSNIFCLDIASPTTSQWVLEGAELTCGCTLTITVTDGACL